MNRIDHLTRIREGFGAVKAAQPEMARAYDEMNGETYADGALSGRMKRLAALTAAITHGCEGCMLFQAEEAIRLGAGAEEIVECCAVAVALAGSMGSSKTAVVVELLREKGMLAD
jgi:AhpD family alkylhydroperoxidase